jgi:hypothetical protein
MAKRISPQRHGDHEDSAPLVDVVRSGILGYKTFNIEVTVGKDHIRKEIPT